MVSKIMLANVHQLSVVHYLTQPDKPLMVAEFWPGWFDHWGEQHHKMEVDKVVTRVSNILRMGASINLFMFHGKFNTTHQDP